MAGTTDTSSDTFGKVRRAVGARRRRLARDVDRATLHAKAAWLARQPAPAQPQDLVPAQALKENGFTIYRGLFSREECAALAADFKAEAGITEGEHYTRVDSANRFENSRRVLFDERILDAVRTAVGDDVRFLQVSDLHYRHDTAGWHRDSVHRALDSSNSADWSDGQFRIVKAILYMEADNAAMGIMAGSHLSPKAIEKDLVKAIEKRNGQVIVDASQNPNRRLTEQEKRRPLAWQANIGDVLVFDQRMYHAGRRIDDGVVTEHNEAPKFTLSLVFGVDNHHSKRFHSYFRYARKELYFKDFNPELRARLQEHDLLLHSGTDNYYLDHPEELRLAHLRNPGELDEMIAEFTRQGAARNS